LLAALEGTMSFCVLHASRGTYDLHEPTGIAFGTSRTKMAIGSDEWKRLDRRKARLMQESASRSSNAGSIGLILGLLLTQAHLECLLEVWT